MFIALASFVISLTPARAADVWFGCSTVQVHKPLYDRVPVTGCHVLANMSDEGSRPFVGHGRSRLVMTEGGDEFNVWQGDVLLFSRQPHAYTSFRLEKIRFESRMGDVSVLMSSLSVAPGLAVVGERDRAHLAVDPALRAQMAQQRWGYLYWIFVEGTDAEGRTFQQRVPVRGEQDYERLMSERTFQQRCEDLFEEPYARTGE